MIDRMKSHYLVTKTTGLFDDDGHAVKEHAFEYTLPFRAADGQFVESSVCGNAFSWAYGLGKNTRTEYERAVRADLYKESADVTSRSLRYVSLKDVRFLKHVHAAPYYLFTVDT